jgi:hypothetical protein
MGLGLGWGKGSKYQMAFVYPNIPRKSVRVGREWVGAGDSGVGKGSKC